MWLIDRARNIITNPKTEWPVIATEETPVESIVTRYVLPLALVPAVASFIAYGVIGVSNVWIGDVRGVGIGVTEALRELVGSVGGVMILAFVIDLLAPSFASKKDFPRAARLSAYSFTPLLVAGILDLIPMFGFLKVIGLAYAIYLLYLGLPHMMETPREKLPIYITVAMIIMIIGFFLILVLLGAILPTPTATLTR